MGNADSILGDASERNDSKKWSYDPYKRVFRLVSNPEFVIEKIGGKLFLKKYVEDNENQKFIFNKKNETSFTNNGLTCGKGGSFKSSSVGGLGSYETADCPKGTTNTGLSCLGSFGRGTGYDDVLYDGWSKCCDLHGDSNEKGKCDDNSYHSRNCQKWGARVYPKCQLLAKKKGYDNPENWTNDACCMCSPSIRSIKKVGKCPPTNDKNNAYTNKTGGLCYTDCEKLYGSGWYNNGTSCAQSVETRGLEDMKCLADEYKTGARCYKKCPHGGTNTGLGTCTTGMDSMKCDDTEFKTGARCYTEPPPMFTHSGGSVTMIKRRIVPYSTPDS